jgi:hypothetical protein
VVFITFVCTALCHRSSLLRFYINTSVSRRYKLTNGTQFVDLIPSLKAINVACCGFSGLNYRRGPWVTRSEKTDLGFQLLSTAVKWPIAAKFIINSLAFSYKVQHRCNKVLTDQ